MLEFLKLPPSAVETIVNPWEKGVWCINIALLGAVLAKLWVHGLAKIYKLLFAYVAFDLLVTLLIPTFDYSTSEYAQFYFIDQTVKIVMAACMLIEMYSLALERHPAMARYGKGLVGFVLLGSAAVPLIVLASDHSEAGRQQLYLRTELLFEQTMNGTMAIFLFIISIFLAWFPIPLRRNVIVYARGFILWALTHSVAVHLVNQFHGNRAVIARINTFQSYLFLVCLLYWFIGLRREGEARTAVVGHLWNRAEAERLTEQLNMMNNTLERLRRK